VAGLRGGVGALVLDADGLSKFAEGNSRAVSFAKDAYDVRAPVVVAASTLAEVLRGSPRDSRVHRVLRRIDIAPIDMTKARAAGELLGRLRLSGHENALDALVAIVALAQPRPVVLLTSDTEDMTRLTEEPERPLRERIAVVRI
jgi:predicted nucleic acid-binding protein